MAQPEPDTKGNAKEISLLRAIAVLPSKSGKHKLYQGTAPIFITTKEKHMKPLIEEAQAAELLEQPSEASMLLRRLRLFNFSKKFKPNCSVNPCPRCFARVILDGAPRGK